jgi:hypothetical protein
MYRRDTWRKSLGGMSGGVFLIGLAIAFLTGAWLPVILITLGVTSLLGAASSGNPNGLYGGLYSIVWLAGLGLCFAIGFWPWILVLVGLSCILGAMRNAIMEAIIGAGLGTLYNANQGQPAYYQPAQDISYSSSTSDPEQTYQPYQEGYQPAPPPTGNYQEVQQQYPYTPQSQPLQSPQYEQPQAQAQYPEELPPQQ